MPEVACSLFAAVPSCMNKLTDVLHIPDTQSAPDARHLAIQRVGV